MIESLHLPAAIVQQLRREALRRYPAEACGFLLGESTQCRVAAPAERGEDERVVAGAERRAIVRRLRPERNRAVRRDRYLIDAADVFAAMRAADASGDEILGVYHSHPDGAAEPSATDLRDAWGEWLYVIVACCEAGVGELTAWRQQDARLVPVQVHEEAS